MIATGKRHAFLYRYEVGFDDEGHILGLDLTLASRCGFSADLSRPVNDRAMFHADNAYWLPDVAIHSYRCRTNTVSDTAFRGFGGPQGMFAIEAVIDEVARALRRDALDVRLANLYGTHERNVTPFGMTVEDNIAPALMRELVRTSRYAERRAEIAAWNRGSPVIKRGIAATPVKFGISFTATHYNQAGALVHVYSDGTVHAQPRWHRDGPGAVHEGAPGRRARAGAAARRDPRHGFRHEQGAQCLATAASSGSDLNGMAAQDAARKLRTRLAAFAARKFDCDPQVVAFATGGARGRRSRCRSRSSHGAPTSRACRSRRRASTPHPRSTTTARRSRGGRSSTTPTARRCPKSPSTRSPASIACWRWTSCTTRARRSTRRSTAARSRAASCRAGAGWRWRSSPGTARAS